MHSIPLPTGVVLCFKSSSDPSTCLHALFHPWLGGIIEVLDDGAELDNASIHMCLIDVTRRLWWLCETTILGIGSVHVITLCGLGIRTDLPNTASSSWVYG
jgi:hypothetical protein